MGVITLAFWSCKKQDPPVDDQDTTSVSDNAVADETFTDVFSNVNTTVSTYPDLLSGDAGRTATAAASAGGSVSTMGMGGTPQTSSSCASVTVTPIANTWPKTVTFDFGSTGCTNDNGVTRTGQIIAVFSGPLTTTGLSRTITFNNYTVNGTKVEGTKVITININKTTNNYVFTEVVSNAKLSNTTTGLNVSWNSTKKLEWITGPNPLVHTDDAFSITGSTSGVNSKGKAFTVLITKPLIRKLACRFIVSGTIQTTESPNNFIRVLDYGDGACDNQATVTINGVSKPIILRK